MKKIMHKVVFLVLLLQSISFSAQVKEQDLLAHEIIGDSILHGFLANGVEFYIKNLPKATGKVQMYFYVKAGTNHQNSDQADFAHAVEHMAFKSTKNFPDGIYGKLESFNKSKMSQFDLNATPGPSFTRYSFKAPANDNEALDFGMTWFREIADGLSMLDEELKSKGDELIQELVIRSNDELEKIFTKNSVLAKIYPCAEDFSNSLEHHKNMDTEGIKNFYNTWYRPELMAVTVIGNIQNPKEVVNMINSKLSGIESKGKLPEEKSCDSIYFNQPKTIAFAENNRDLSKTGLANIDLYYRDPETFKQLSTLEGVKRLEKIELYMQILNNRLEEKGNRYDSFSNFHISHPLKSTKIPPAFKISISSAAGNEYKALEDVGYVLRQIRQYGVLREEFLKIKKEKLLEYEDKIKSQRFWQDEIESHLMYREPLLMKKSKVLIDWWKKYNLQEFNLFVKNLKLDSPDDIGIIATSGHKALGYDGNFIRSALKKGARMVTKPYNFPETPTELLSPEEIRSLPKKEYIDLLSNESNVRKIMLNNGTKVVLKSFVPTPGVNSDKIILQGFRTKGALSYSSKDYFSAVNSPKFVKHAGVHHIDKFQLQRFMNMNSLWWNGVYLYINDEESGIKLDINPEDFEVMLQLVYLYFNKPRKDSLAFENWKVEEKISYFDSADLKLSDLDNIRKAVFNDDSGSLKGSDRFSGISKTDFERGWDIFNQIFSKPEEFTFIITGNFSIEEAIPIVNRYLGNLQDQGKKKNEQQSYHSGFNLPQGPLYIKSFFPELNTKNNLFYSPRYVQKVDSYNWKQSIEVEALGRVLDQKLWDLRFKENYPLYVVAGFGFLNYSNSTIELGANLDCPPEVFEAIRKEFKKIISRFKTESIPDNYLQQSLMRMKSKYDSSGNANTQSYVQEELYLSEKYDIPKVDPSIIQKYLKTIGPDDIQKWAQKYFKEENLYEFVRMNRNDSTLKSDEI